MMIEEFEYLTGFYPSLTQYEQIEAAYLDFDGDKVAFCKAYKANRDGLAVMRNVNSFWTLLAHGCGACEDETVDWDYSTGGHFEERRLPYDRTE